MAKTFRLGLIFSAMAFFASSARADEADDALSRSLGAVVRDPRLSIWSRVDAVRTLTKLGPRATASLPDLVLVLNRIRGKEQEALQEAIIEAIGQIGSPSKAALPALSKVASRTPDIERAARSSIS